MGTARSIPTDPNNTAATPIHDTPISDLIMRPKVPSPVEYGNDTDFWVEYPSGLVDLSRADHLPADVAAAAKASPPPLKSTQAEIEVNGERLIRVDKEKTAIVIIDMQKNWGLTDHELKTIPPSLVRSFRKHNGGGFGSELPGNFGRLLMRDAFNSELYGPLQEEFVQGAKAGTDFWIHKNRMSGIWGYQTALDLFLKEHGITTLLLSGVNTDQCVLGTLVDAYFRGYDCIVLEDATATTSPEGGYSNTVYNAGNSYGFVTDTAKVIAAAQQ
ncbi:hypothetical protein HYPSUDRAFT_521472 [Hypholoma sublateritium FD-334 SS-4]|uniref:Isochorismatase-like domain-containing protein n=1 Tax=Hypholoma sublateritium (strain FD-334 SS-4) TaxID=945553 RepID=A0A0D2QCU5_HYPSF|nr:hypothetical protein HYPSUDRAFT_521472 [Hypholoma sublateritium FD-334 SS-4]